MMSKAKNDSFHHWNHNSCAVGREGISTLLSMVVTRTAKKAKNRKGFFLRKKIQDFKYRKTINWSELVAFMQGICILCT